ncbi:MAG: DNA mismatch repair protein MutS [Methylococcaceae bacterium]|nr:DNA mismatch repair protein MutS [Methylococcaceae bacterium]
MKEPLLQSWQNDWPQIKSSKPLAAGAGVIDENAFNIIEVDKMFDAVNCASTTIGQAVLYRSLTQPLENVEAIKAKQLSVEEIRTNPSLKGSLEQVLQHAASQENNFYLLLFGEFLGTFGIARNPHEIEGYGYLQYKRGIRFILELLGQIQALEAVQTDYLRGLIEKIKSFTDTRAYALMQGPVYVTERGLQSRHDRKNGFTPAVIFTPSLFKPLLLFVIIATLWLVTHFALSDVSGLIPSQAVFLAPLLLLYMPIVGGFDRDKCIVPLRNEFRQSSEVGEFLDALGQLDELFSFIRYADDFGHTMVLPTLLDDKHHRVKLVDAKNPVLGKHNQDYIGNDLDLVEEKLVLVTGPNSGGKTAFCKTVTQIQLLGQIGCYVPAKSASLTVADKIFYQVPEISHLNDGEGRFGTELKRTKDIFLASTAKSLVVLDELSEGTTFEEKMESSSNVLNGFYRKGNSTILITHNHQLVDSFVNQKIGLAKQVEFAHDAPTYRLIDGISRVSHADRVAKKIGFSKEDIDTFLADSK